MEEIGRCKAIRLTFNDPNTTQARNCTHSPVLFTENAGFLRSKKEAANEEAERAGGCQDRWPASKLGVGQAACGWGDDSSCSCLRSHPGLLGYLDDKVLVDIKKYFIDNAVFKRMLWFVFHQDYFYKICFLQILETKTFPMLSGDSPTLVRKRKMSWPDLFTFQMENFSDDKKQWSFQMESLYDDKNNDHMFSQERNLFLPWRGEIQSVGRSFTSPLCYQLPIMCVFSSQCVRRRSKWRRSRRRGRKRRLWKRGCRRPFAVLSRREIKDSDCLNFAA